MDTIRFKRTVYSNIYVLGLIILKWSCGEKQSGRLGVCVVININQSYKLPELLVHQSTLLGRIVHEVSAENCYSNM